METFNSCIEAGASRLSDTLRTQAPHLATPVAEWLEGIAPAGKLAGYFTHENRFPMLSIPWWIADAVGVPSTDPLRADVIYSTMAGYCSIRLIDDLLDGATARLDLVPALAVFHSEFQFPYQRYFPAEHPFWELFRARWFGAADFARDHPSTSDFEIRVRHRLGPAEIPVAAVLFHAGRLDQVGSWGQLLNRIGRVEQLLDDLTDWLDDHRRKAPNIVLANHRARAQPNEGLEPWMLREGYQTAIDLASTWLNELATAARPFGVVSLDQFIARREAMVRQMATEVAPGLAALAELRSAFDRPA